MTTSSKRKDPIMPNILCSKTVVMPAISVKVVKSEGGCLDVDDEEEAAPNHHLVRSHL